MVSDYVLTIKLDDTQLNRQLAKFKQVFAGGGTSSGGGSTTDQIGKFAKFGMIALGVTEIVKMFRKVTSMLVDSSPLLKQMLNLFNNELMLMLMPLGTFIGAVLQPILLAALRYFILPFYRYFYPLALRYGYAIGDGLAQLIPYIIQGKFASDLWNDIKTGLSITPIINVTMSAADIAKSFDLSKVQEKINNLAGLFNLSKVREKINNLVDLFDSMWRAFTPEFDKLYGYFDMFKNNIKNTFDNIYAQWDGFKDAVSEPLDFISVIFKSMANALARVLDKIWFILDGFRSALNDALSPFTSALNKLKKSVGDPKSLASGKSPLSGLGDSGGIRTGGGVFGVLSDVLKRLPEISTIIGLATGQPGWIVPGLGFAGGGEPNSNQVPNAPPPPVFQMIVNAPVYAVEDLEKLVGQFVQTSYNKLRGR